MPAEHQVLESQALSLIKRNNIIDGNQAFSVAIFDLVCISHFPLRNIVLSFLANKSEKVTIWQHLVKNEV